MNTNFDFDKWSEKYHNKRYIEELKHIDKKYVEIAKKLGITIEDKLYTEYELEALDMDLLQYYKADDMDEADLEFTKPLDGTGVTRDEYNELLEQITKIVEKYI